MAYLPFLLKGWFNLDLDRPPWFSPILVLKPEEAQVTTRQEGFTSTHIWGQFAILE